MLNDAECCINRLAIFLFEGHLELPSFDGQEILMRGYNDLFFGFDWRGTSPEKTGAGILLQHFL